MTLSFHMGFFPDSDSKPERNIILQKVSVIPLPPVPENVP